jgi:hypothetical protein
LRGAGRLGGVLGHGARPFSLAVLFAHNVGDITDGAHPKRSTLLVIGRLYIDVPCSTGANQVTRGVTRCIRNDEIILANFSTDFTFAAIYDALAGWYVVICNDLCGCDNIFVLLCFSIVSGGYRPERLKHGVRPFVAESAEATNHVQAAFGSSQLLTIQNRGLVVCDQHESLARCRVTRSVEYGKVYRSFGWFRA